MITGEVSADGQAIVYLRVFGPDGQEEEVEALVDTGFDGYLALPAPLIALLRLRFVDYLSYLQGDGEPQLFAVHEAAVAWKPGAPPVTVLALASNSSVALIGMALLRGYNLNIDVVDGGQVAITELRHA